MNGVARLHLGAVALLAFVVIAGTAAASSPSLRLMILGLNNLPAGYAQDYSHSISKADVMKEQGFVMPGYVTGWEAQYTRSEGFNTAIIDSSVNRYGTSAQARASIFDSSKRAAKQKGMKRISLGASFGQDARAYTFDTKQGGVAVKVYIVAWRYGSLKASVLLAGLASLGATAEQVKQLALKQHARMARYG